MNMIFFLRTYLIMLETDIIFSINVHEKKEYLIKQVKNINDNVT